MPSTSPGRAFLANPWVSMATQGGHFKPYWMQSDWERAHPWNAPAGLRGGIGIDPTDPAVRKAAFESGGFGEISSWGTDATFQFFADPTIVAGKFIKRWSRSPAVPPPPSGSPRPPPDRQGQGGRDRRDRPGQVLRSAAFGTATSPSSTSN